MRLADYDFYHDFLREKTGLSLTQEKAYLLDSRLTPIARKWGYANLETLTMAMRGVPPPELAHEIIESVMAHDTSFFRDLYPFNYLRDTALPAFAKSRRKTKRIRVWCAGISEGQEAYSIAMLLKDLPRQVGWSYQVLATDISQEVMDRATKGIFTQSEAQRGLSIHLLLKYFDRKKDGRWEAKRSLKSLIEFRHHNLLEPLRGVGLPDIVLCRYVLADFDPATRRSIIRALCGAMAPDGVLCLGRNETADGLEDLIAPIPGTSGLFSLVHQTDDDIAD
jgi:chemotaxis protein methyltransferase CheR